MGAVPPPVLSYARAHHGLVTAECLTADLIGRHARARLLRQQFLESVHPGVYRITSHAVTFEQRCLAACLAADVVICGPSAGRLLRLRQMPRGPVHAMSYRRKIELQGVVVHRTTTLGSGDITLRPDGVRVLKPSRLVPDLARSSTTSTSSRSSSSSSIVGRPAFLRSAPAVGGSGLPDATVRFVWLVCSTSGRPGSSRRTRTSRSESFGALADRGIHLVPQFEPDIGDVVLIHFDATDPAIRLGVEVDHVTWHGGRVATQRDKSRDRRALRLGWQVVRVTDEDLTIDFDGVIDEVAEIHQRRAADRQAS